MTFIDVLNAPLNQVSTTGSNLILYYFEAILRHYQNTEWKCKTPRKVSSQSMHVVALFGLCFPMSYTRLWWISCLLTLHLQRWNPETNWEKNLAPLKSRGIFAADFTKATILPSLFVQGRMEPFKHSISVLPLCCCCGWPGAVVLSVRQCCCCLFASIPGSAEHAKWEMRQPASSQMAF